MNSESSLIGLCGRESSGKTTVAEFLCGKQKLNQVYLQFTESFIINLLFGKLDEEEYREKSDLVIKFFTQIFGYNFNYLFDIIVSLPDDLPKHPTIFHHLSFATPLKIIVCMLFKLDFDLVDGNTLENRILRETLEVSFFCKGPKTVRELLRYIGLSAREFFGQDIWVNIMKRKLKNINGNCIISDVRFDNEVEMIRQYNGFLVCVYKHKLDLFVKDDEHISSINFIKWTQVDNKHQVDYYLQNDDTLDKLKQRLDDILKHTKICYRFPKSDKILSNNDIKFLNSFPEPDKKMSEYHKKFFNSFYGKFH